MAAAHVVACLTCVHIVREGHLAEIAPSRLLSFVPEHIILWRSGCVALAAASLTFVTFVVCAREVLDERASTLATLAVVFATMATACELNGLFAMMVLYSDLAQQFGAHGAFLVHETIQLAWATMDQALSNCLLIGNTLYGLSGLLIMRSAALTESFPKWLVWAGLPIWIVTLAVSALSFMGALKWVLMITVSTVLVFVLWSTALGVTYRRHARLLVAQLPTPGDG